MPGVLVERPLGVDRAHAGLALERLEDPGARQHQRGVFRRPQERLHDGERAREHDHPHGAGREARAVALPQRPHPARDRGRAREQHADEDDHDGHGGELDDRLALGPVVGAAALHHVEQPDRHAGDEAGEQRRSARRSRQVEPGSRLPGSVPIHSTTSASASP